ncbi:ABC transporter permease [Sphingorhabdus arenilitoris]|uniref:ABC transporter permease n=1 Tax=Sphingorhabdus arenilitoris TaxID=1490041 RepID=A0ABV8RIW1_9SPHN
MKEIIRAAFVIGRRDLTAIIFSKAFILFLLGPLFPVIVAVAAGSLGGQIARDSDKPIVGVLMQADEAAKLVTVRDDLSQQLGDGWYPELKAIGAPDGAGAKSPREYLSDTKNNLVAVVSGTLEKPIITATKTEADRHDDEIASLVSYAVTGKSTQMPKPQIEIIEKSASGAKKSQQVTGQLAQVIMYFLTVLLTGMVLSNLVEEKSNKIIEILAASIPIESVFIGKLFAMLVMSLIGLTIWIGAGLGLFSLFASGVPMAAIPAPAVGWPIFLTLGVIYFTMTYLMLGALFLGIGAMAATVREVQTLSMPVTMVQLIIFFFAAYTVTQLGKPIEQAAAIFPFSSPFAMIARAAQVPTLWHHAIAVIGQIFFTIALLRIGVILFKRNVMKSGSGGKVKEEGTRRKLFGLIPMGR